MDYGADLFYYRGASLVVSALVLYKQTGYARISDGTALTTIKEEGSDREGKEPSRYQHRLVATSTPMSKSRLGARWLRKRVRVQCADFDLTRTAILERNHKFSESGSRNSYGLREPETRCLSCHLVADTREVYYDRSSYD